MSKQYEENIRAEQEGSMKSSPIANIGDIEVLTIKCRSCQAILFQMKHKLGDDIVTEINVDTFRFKAYCKACIDSITRGF